jgi:radical SAM superfamily enzyme YgiQ (UPF0313 family)
MPRRVALVAVDAQWRDPNGTFYSFSYGIEKLRAAILSDPELADTEVLLLDLRSGDPEEYFQRIVEFGPTLVGLSTYIWSLDVFAELTERLRGHDPRMVIVAGGPAARRNVFDLAPHRPLRDRLDAIVPGEGEATIRDLVRHHLEPGWKTQVAGLQLPSRGLWRSTDPAERPDINAYASPYQLDLAPLHKTGYVETFRGCPIHCAFCQWGDQKSDRVHDVDFLARHLEGLRRAEVPNVFFLDAAFNLSPRAFRNLVEAESQVRVLEHSIVHGHLYPTYLQDQHLDFFDRCGQVQASVGIQSFDPKVLERLGRPFDIARFQGVLKRMRGRLDVDIELIFGLPGDNPESFRRTLETSMELGDSVKIFRCLVLPDALLERAADMAIEYDPRTFEMLACEGWTAEQYESEWRAVVELASTFERPILNDDWVGWVLESGGGGRREDSEGDAIVFGRDQTTADPGPLAAAEVGRLREIIATNASGWGLERVHGRPDQLLFDLASPHGQVVLEIVRFEQGARYFAQRDHLAYSYRGALAQQSAPGLRSVIDVVHADLVRVVS